MLLAISPAETVEFDMVSKRQAFVKVSNPNDFACAFKVLFLMLRFIVSRQP